MGRGRPDDGRYAVVRGQTGRMVRVQVSDETWRAFRQAALIDDIPAGKLLGILARAWVESEHHITDRPRKEHPS